MGILCFSLVPATVYLYPAVRPHELDENKARISVCHVVLQANNIDDADSLHYAYINGTTKKLKRKKTDPCALLGNVALKAGDRGVLRNDCVTLISTITHQKARKYSPLWLTIKCQFPSSLFALCSQ